MSTTAPHVADTHVSPSSVGSRIYVCLPSLSVEALRRTLFHLLEAFPEDEVTISTPDSTPSDPVSARLQVVPYVPSVSSEGSWVPSAADFVNCWTTTREHNPAAILILGADSESVSPQTLRNLVQATLQGQDLVIPRYPVGPHEALVNSAVLYPLSRALFSNPVRFPLPIDLALSSRMAQRMATNAQRLTASNQGSALVWPVAEAAVAGFSACDTAGESRVLPHPSSANLNALLATVVGSMFSDVEAKAAFWQRARLTGRSHPRDLTHTAPASAPEENPLELEPMIESFRLAYTNLSELWSLVLPPNSLLSLKKLSLSPRDTFQMPDELWARTVYDFLLAFRLRTINRGHLLGALTPLYLGWAASHLRIVGGDAAGAERHVESVAAAFENDKPYLVSRWRWPDRFNP